MVVGMMEKGHVIDVDACKSWWDAIVFEMHIRRASEDPAFHPVLERNAVCPRAYDRVRTRYK